MSKRIMTKLVPAEPSLVVVDMNRMQALFAEIRRQGFKISHTYTLTKVYKLSQTPEGFPLGTIDDVEDRMEELYGDIPNTDLITYVIEVNATPESVQQLDREILRKRIGYVISTVRPYREGDENG